MAAEIPADEPLTPLASASRLLTRRYRTWLVAMLLALSTLNAADRAILSVLAEPIKVDLKLTDTQLGMLQGLGFALLFSVLGLPLGWLAERVNRRGLIACCVTAWSLMTGACALASGFGTMLLCRVGVGIGEAGFQPSAFSLVADHFKAQRRASIVSLILLGNPLGFLIGQSIGGWTASLWGWRAAFFVLGIPGLLAALLTWRTVQEPPRGLVDAEAAAPAARSLSILRELWSKRSFRHLLVGLSVSGFAMNAVAQFVLPFYLRAFQVSLAVVGVAFGAVVVSSNGLGMLLGGFGVDWLTRRDARWGVWGPAATTALATPFYYAAFASKQFGHSLACIWIANLLLASSMGPTFAQPQNLVGPRMRAFTAALVAMVLGLLGMGLGPTLLGVASDAFARRSFSLGSFVTSCPGGRAGPAAPAALEAACRAASIHGLRYALLAVVVFFLWGAVHFLLAARTLRQDLYRPAEGPVVKSVG